MDSDSTVRSSVLLVTDGLRPSALGPYGNTWFDTLSFNQLAGNSLLFEKCISDTPDQQTGFQGLLTGQHSCTQSDYHSNPFSIVSKGGAETVLVTVSDRGEPYREWFDRVVEIELAKNSTAASDLSETELASYFAAAIQAIRETDQPTCFVLDCPGLSSAWDAPLDIRKQLADEEDPDPPEFVEPPSLQFNHATDDPDLLFGYQAAYSAQIVVLDRLLGLFLDELDGNFWLRDALFCLTATRAFPLGEHGVVGFYRPILHGELLNVPAFVRYPKSRSIMGRSQQLIQPGSLFQCIHQWHCRESTSFTNFPMAKLDEWLPDKRHSAVVSTCNLDGVPFYSLQTQAWKYISGPASRLYVNPDDIWEFNDASGLCSNVGELMNRELQDAVDTLIDGKIHEFDLPDELAFGVE